MKNLKSIILVAAILAINAPLLASQRDTPDNDTLVKAQRHLAMINLANITHNFDAFISALEKWDNELTNVKDAKVQADVRQARRELQNAEKLVKDMRRVVETQTAKNLDEALNNAANSLQSAHTKLIQRQ